MLGCTLHGWPNRMQANPSAGPHAPLPTLAQVLGRALQHMRAGAGLAGTVFWMLAAPSYGDFDGFTVYFSSQSKQSGRSLQQGSPAPQPGRTAAVIRQHAAAVAALNAPAAGGPQEPTLNPLLPASASGPQGGTAGVAFVAEGAAAVSSRRCSCGGSSCTCLCCRAM